MVGYWPEGERAGGQRARERPRAERGQHASCRGAGGDSMSFRRKKKLGSALKNVELQTDEVIRQGWLLKQGNRIKTWKKRWMVLNRAFLLYFKSGTHSEQRRHTHACISLPWWVVLSLSLLPCHSPLPRRLPVGACRWAVRFFGDRPWRGHGPRWGRGRDSHGGGC